MGMRTTRFFAVAGLFLLGICGLAGARLAKSWSYQEMFDKSDVVVIATVAATNDTPEHIPLPGFTSQPVIGVETKWTVSAVLKGGPMKELVLHHYRVNGFDAPNGPNLVSFVLTANPPGAQRSYILFLVREADGRYAPVVGQIDPYQAVRVLSSPDR